MSIRVFSGIQPTGRLHLGNYLGALKQWSGFQNSEAERFFCVVDLHAITVKQDPRELSEAVLTGAAAYVASGLDPKKSCIFRQSAVPAHSELQWLLACATPLGWLRRMTQYKEKTGKDKDVSCLGLLAYPVLMAADILLYSANTVPVGEDQKQHIELARDIACSFNSAVGEDVFTLPEPVILTQGARVMSLRDGSKKMSKSDISDASRINLQDSDDLIRTKIKKAKSDSIEGVYIDASRPEITNLLHIFATLADKKTEEVERAYRSETTSKFKEDLADLVISSISPMRDNMRRLLDQDAGYIRAILLEGEARAVDEAAPMLAKVKRCIGLQMA